MCLFIYLCCSKVVGKTVTSYKLLSLLASNPTRPLKETTEHYPNCLPSILTKNGASGLELVHLLVQVEGQLSNQYPNQAKIIWNYSFYCDRADQQDLKSNLIQARLRSCKLLFLAKTLQVVRLLKGRAGMG